MRLELQGKIFDLLGSKPRKLESLGRPLSAGRTVTNLGTRLLTHALSRFTTPLQITRYSGALARIEGLSWLHQAVLMPNSIWQLSPFDIYVTGVIDAHRSDCRLTIRARNRKLPNSAIAIHVVDLDSFATARQQCGTG